VVVLHARGAHAEPCAREAAELRATLERDADRAAQWNLDWRLAFTALAAAQTALAITPSLDHETREAAWVGAAKASTGMITCWAMPLHIEAPPPLADACADAAALRIAVARAAHDERNAFWLDHVGSLVVNIAGAIVLAERTRWQAGALSFALGYPVGLLHTYTMPRGSWHVQPIATPGGVAIGVTGAF